MIINIRIDEIIHLIWLLIKASGTFFFYALIIFGIGYTFLKVIRLKLDNLIEIIIISFGLGEGLVSHLLLAAGALHLLYPATGWAIAIAGIGLSCFHLMDRLYKSGFKISINIPKPEFSLGQSLFILIILVNLALPFVRDVIVPPYSNDEIAYHLPIPQIYNAAHQIAYISFIPYANWTLETEMLFGLGLLLRSEVMAHLVSWSALSILSLGIFAIGKRFSNTTTGLLAAALFTSAPMVRMEAGLALIELTLTLFTFLSVYCLLRWIESKVVSYWILSAVFAGLAASAKFNGVLTPVSLGILYGLFLIFNHRPFSLSRGIKGIVGYGFIALAVVSPWYIKSWILTANPLWSFLPGIFTTRDWDALGSEYLIGYIQNPNLPISVLNWFRALPEIILNPGNYGGPQASLGLYPLVLLPFWPLGPFLSPSKYKKVYLAAILISLMLYTAWFFTTHQSRFLMPALPFFSFLGAAGLISLSNRVPKWGQQGMLITVLVLLVATNWVFDPYDIADLRTNSDFLLGRSSREEFLKLRVPGYSAISYANQHLPTNANVFMGLYEVRGYYLERRYFWANPVAQRVIKYETIPNSDNLAQLLLRDNFDYILYNTQTIDAFDALRYGPENASKFKELINRHGRLLFDAGSLQVYQIMP